MEVFMRRLSSVVPGLHAVDVDVPLEVLCKDYWIDSSKWEVFVNDDRTRTFVSVEVITAGLAEITKQIQAVNEVYKLHNLRVLQGSTPSYIVGLGIGRHQGIPKESGRR